jgi:cytochrome c-type biogenesis protein CcmH/NrfG
MPPHHSTTVQRHSLDTISVWALMITLIVAIFIAIPSASIPFIATKTFLLAAGAIITLALYILARLSRGNAIFPPWVLIGAMWLPALAYLFSSLFSGVSFTSAFWGSSFESDTLGFMLLVAVLGTLAALLLRRSENYRTFLRVSAIVFCVVVVLELLILLVGQVAPNTISPAFSIIGSYDDLSSFLGLGVITILLTFRFIELPKRSHRLLIAAVVGALVLLAVANSTLVWTLLALVSLGLFVESVMKRSSHSSSIDLDGVGDAHESTPVETGESNRSLVLPLIILVVSLFFLIGSSLGQALATSLNANVVSVRPSWQSTLDVAQKTYATSPIFGTGPNTFVFDWLKNRDASLNTSIFWDTDFTSGIGFIPTSFVSTGLLGALAWIALLALLLWFGMRTLIQRAPKDNFVRYVAIVSFVAALYLFAIAIFDLPNAVILALTFVFTGIFVSTTRFAEGSGQWGIIFSRSPRLGFVIVFSLTIILLGSVGVAYALIDHYLAATELTYANETLSTSGNLDTASAAVQSSISFAPTAAAYELQANIANAQLSQLSSAGISTSNAQTFQTTLSNGINSALTATRLDPSDYQAWILLGNLYAQAVPLGVTGAYTSAQTAYQKAEALSPTNPQIPYTIAELDVADKDNADAETQLKDAITLKQDYTAAIFLLSQLEVQDGDVKDALAAALAAAYFTPNNPNILFQVGILRAATNDLPDAATALAAAVSADPQFANAMYFLSAVYAKEGDYKDALAQLEAVAALSPANAKAVASEIVTLEAGKNPFPANLLSVSPQSVPTTPAPTTH